MRRFTDDTGTTWDVVLGRESWGTLVVLFIPAGNAPVRQAHFPATSYDTAAVELDELSEERLQQLLAAAELKPD
jgi:hypothetical protein